MRAPQKINSYILFDWETGGLSCVTNPVTELAAIAINGVTLQEILRYDDLIKPYDNSLVYDPIAAKVSGISREMCEKDGIPLKQLAENFAQVCKEANIHNSKTARPILVAHNADFDRGFLMEVSRRAKLDLSVLIDGDIDCYGNFIPHVIDTVDLAKALWAEVTNKEDKFKLGYCCNRAGVDYVDGHRAMNDVIPMTDLFRYMVTRLRSGSSEVKVSEGEVSIHRKTFEW